MQRLLAFILFSAVQVLLATMFYRLATTRVPPGFSISTREKASVNTIQDLSADSPEAIGVSQTTTTTTFRVRVFPTVGRVSDCNPHSLIAWIGFAATLVVWFSMLVLYWVPVYLIEAPESASSSTD